MPLTDLEALSIKGVYWPLHERSVKLGETLTLSNRSAGPISLQLASGAAIVLAYPEGNL